jgi:acetolactate synthase-1/2/3 large subunit
MNAAARSLEVLTAPPQVAWSAWAAAAQADYRANMTPPTAAWCCPATVDMPR